MCFDGYVYLVIWGQDAGNKLHDDDYDDDDDDDDDTEK